MKDALDPTLRIQSLFPFSHFSIVALFPAINDYTVRAYEVKASKARFGWFNPGAFLAGPLA
jgi:hypothetical protein